MIDLRDSTRELRRVRRLTVAITDEDYEHAAAGAEGDERPDADAQTSPRGRRKELKVVWETEPGDARR